MQCNYKLGDDMRRFAAAGRCRSRCDVSIGCSFGSGLLAALPTVYPGVPVQRCWAHKIRNVLGKVRKAEHKAAKAGLHAVMNANTLIKARSAARRPRDARLRLGRRIQATNH